MKTLVDLKDFPSSKKFTYLNTASINNYSCNFYYGGVHQLLISGKKSYLQAFKNALKFL